MTDLNKFKISLPARRARLLPEAGSTGRAQEALTVAQVVSRYEQAPARRVRCLLLFDATSSMQPYWTHVRATLDQIIERLLPVHGDMTLKIVAYRDDCDGPRIIESSGWSADAQTLAAFVGLVACAGGGDTPEAVDRALQVAQAEQDDLSAVVLIGDAPPHPERDGCSEARALGTQQRPVFPIAVGGAENTREAFGAIARLSGGRMIDLDKIEELYDVLGVVLARAAGPSAFEGYLKRYAPSLTPGGQRAARLLTDGRR
jgi:hypothetical protein